MPPILIKPGPKPRSINWKTALAIVAGVIVPICAAFIGILPELLVWLDPAPTATTLPLSTQVTNFATQPVSVVTPSLANLPAPATGPPTTPAGMVSEVRWSITEPENWASVQFPVDARGTYDPALLGEDELWVFLQPVGGDYVPQLASCAPLRSAVSTHVATGLWEARLDLDEDTSGSSHIFKIVLFRAVTPLTDEYTHFLQHWCEAGGGPGLVVPRNYGLEPLVLVNVRRVQ